MLSFMLATSAEIAQELGSRLRTQRMSKDISQKDLALRAGISPATVSKIEKTGSGDFDSILRMVMALDLASELEGLFNKTPMSIAELAAMENSRRQRVSRKSSGSRR